MAKLTVNDLDVHGKRVFVRVDYNVPMEEKDGQMVITDVTRIKETLPTLELLIEQGRANHPGRASGPAQGQTRAFHVAAARRSQTGGHGASAGRFRGRLHRRESRKNGRRAARPGDILLLENVRYYNEEEANDPAFAEKLAKLADVYVNDAFGAAHRAHASTEGVARVIARARRPMRCRAC